MVKTNLTDLHIEKRLDKISNKAVKDNEKTRSLVIPNVGKPKRIALNISPESLNMRDDKIEKRLDKIANNSIIAQGEYIPLSVESEITPEMVEQYRQQERENEIILPASYVPELEADLSIHINNLEKQYPQVLENYENQIEYELNRIDAYSGELKKVRKQLEDIKDEFNTGLTKIRQNTGINDNQKQQRIFKIEKEFNDNRQGLLQQEQKWLQKLNGAEYDLQNVKEIMSNYVNGMNDLRGKMSDITRSNKEKIKLMEEEINNLNRGRFSIQQFEGETDDEYLQRMQDVGNTEMLPQDLEEEIILYQSKVFKAKMKEIIRRDDIIETVLKMIKDEFGIKGLQYVNEVFPFIKTEFIKVFGQYPVQVSPNNVFSLIKSVSSGSKETKEMVKDLKIMQKEEVEDLLGAPLPLNAPQAKAIPTQQALKNVFNKHLLSFIQEFEDYHGLQKSKVNARTVKEQLIKIIIDNDYEFKLDQNASGEKILVVPEAGGGGGGGGAAAAAFPDFDDEGGFNFGFGLKGVKMHKFPKLVGFGKLSINPNDLFYSNKLAIRNKEGRSLTGFPDVHGVSDGFVNIVMKILKDDKPTQQDFKQLGLNEKSLFDSLIYHSKLNKIVPDIPNSADNTLKELKNRLTLLEGEIMAGNNNDDIKKETHSVVHRLVGMGALNHNMARNYLNDLIGHIVKPRRSPKK